MDGDLLFPSVLLCESRKHNYIKMIISKTLPLRLEVKVTAGLRGGGERLWLVKTWAKAGIGLWWFEALLIAAEVTLEVSLDLLDELLLDLSWGRVTPKRGL